MLPAHLQLGVGQLAEADDEEMRSLARDLPWQDMIRTGLTFIPCAIALCAERRRGSDSLFDEYLSQLPESLNNAVACCEGGFGHDSSDSRFDAPADLGVWAPTTAAKAQTKRNAMRVLHSTLVPPSLPMRDLCWASAIVSSRGLVRKRARALTPHHRS